LKKISARADGEKKNRQNLLPLNSPPLQLVLILRIKKKGGGWASFTEEGRPEMGM
jgi:hypothetical protein